MAAPLRVSFYGAGQTGTNASAILRGRDGFEVLGPFSRKERELALRSGADVVVIATTSFLAAIGDDVRDAVEAGSNVITTAEEAAAPWSNDPDIAHRLDALARSRGVTILGGGVNPGFAFDALVLTICGVTAGVESLLVERVVDIGGFGATVLRRLGVGLSAEEFEAGRATGTVTGHIGFPQSMRVVAGGLGVEIERIDRELGPLFAQEEVALPALTIAAGETAVVSQRYVASAGGQAWFEARFTGHVAPASIGQEPRDAITVRGVDGPVHFAATPGINPQRGSAAMVANSVRRVVTAPPGWVTVAELPPAMPR